MALPEERRFDIRLIESRLRRGDVSAEEWQKYLDSLPDEEEESETCKTQFTPTFASSHYQRKA